MDNNHSNNNTIPKTNTKELLDAQTHIWTHIFNFLTSMALKCAIQLQIPDTIHTHGQPMTLDELSDALSLHPNKACSLYRLTRLLVHSKFLSITKLPDGNDAFALTINSQLLLKDHPMTLSPFALAMLDPTLTEPAHHFSTWFRSEDETPFHIVNGVGIWKFASLEPGFNGLFNDAMASDAKFVSEVLLGDVEFRRLFEGVGTFVDVGGGTGTLAKGIAKCFPGVKCSVLELPHVVQGLQENDCCLELEYVGGDMFEAVPCADVVLLKWILHDWSDELCIKILKRCKEAIPSKDKGGKVIILDVVVGAQNDTTHVILDSQLKFDMEMLSVTIGGKERTEPEWSQLFVQSGFSTYDILPILGSRSVIIAYPS